MIGYPKQILIRSKGFLKFVASLPCMICGGFSQAHHLLRTGEHSAGRKSGDDKAVPLCPPHHRALHDSGDEIGFFEMHGWPYPDVIQYAAKNYETFLQKR